MAEKQHRGRGATRKNVRMQELFLPVHGHITLYPEEIAIIDHPSFQRLRRVRQLGLAHIVFPGGVHTRLEHSIGAVHVAQTIIQHVNSNYEMAAQEASGEWHIEKINDNVARLIRLGALLHDVGHLPFGHTLEDELNHLRSHDGRERLQTIGQRSYPHYDIDKSIGNWTRPPDGWSLKGLVSVLYKDVLNGLQIDLEPFEVLCAIICKAPKEKTAKNEDDDKVRKAWQALIEKLEPKIELQVCRDVVGNTICADFLDYLYRDWYHLGKPLYEDKRLYQYMEARAKTDGDNKRISRFVINIGQADRVRHDALTNILELLENRYKLAETVLFHRTKLALTALLDRCLLEIRDLHKLIGIDQEFPSVAEELFLNGSDDGLPEILIGLAKGGSEEGKEKFKKLADVSKEKIVEAVAENSPRDLLTAQSGLSPDLVKTEIEDRLNNISQLIERLRDRCVYSMAYKLKISDFPGAHSPDNTKLAKLIKLYKTPENRYGFLRGIETLCNLPIGSLVIYCPPSASMNAKIASVNLLIDGDVTPFAKYDKTGEDSSLTRGALWAQIRRFYELWSAQVYVERTAWDSLTAVGKGNLRATIEAFFFQMRRENSVNIVRAQVEASVKAVVEERPVAARHGTRNPETEKLSSFIFPSGMPFANADESK